MANSRNGSDNNWLFAEKVSIESQNATSAAKPRSNWLLARRIAMGKQNRNMTDNEGGGRERFDFAYGTMDKLYRRKRRKR